MSDLHCGSDAGLTGSLSHCLRCGASIAAVGAGASLGYGLGYCVGVACAHKLPQHVVNSVWLQNAYML